MGHFKDGFHQCIIQGTTGAVCPNLEGTKACAHYQLDVPAGVTLPRLADLVDVSVGGRLATVTSPLKG